MGTSSFLEELFKIPAIAEARELLKAKLPATLRYHTAQHTDDVVSEVVTFALAGKVPRDQIRLLAIAAAWHDAGFTDRFTENEEIGAKLAVAAMQRQGGYSEADVRLVETMIRDTRVQLTPDGARQVPTTPLSRYLLDADVSNLGRGDFFEKAELVRAELGNLPKAAFYGSLVHFIESHRWYTDAAKELREAKKSENLAALRKLAVS